MDLREVGYDGLPRTATGDANAASVLAKLVVSPSRSTREVAQECATSQAPVPRILSVNHFHPYRIHFVQELHGDDTDMRVQFCEWFLERRTHQPNLEADIYSILKLPYLDNLPLERRRGFFFQQDGTLQHFRLTVRELLNEVIPGRWIGCRDPVEWPPKSPDLTPLGFFLRRHLKSVVYSNRPRKLDELQENIRRECAQITPAVLRNVRSSYLNHA
ncbi:hypothetical protein ANN_10869 [Periplaneta americana]|uniref:Uncharacterized protein n=1 Tax=Periplaneta americana TaxID=6978 RepID=A0ABQ8T559_PERAM|nr:hypothetical protein ANN_10869 [Periplaneta americana]